MKPTDKNCSSDVLADSRARSIELAPGRRFDNTQAHSAAASTAPYQSRQSAVEAEMATTTNAAAGSSDIRMDHDSQAAAAQHDSSGDALAKEPLLHELKSSCDAVSVKSSDVSLFILCV